MEARWQPWLDALQRCTRPSRTSPGDGDRTSNGRVFWIRWDWPNLGDEDTWLLVFEAFELLAIAAHTDQALWRQLMESYWSFSSAYWADTPLSDIFQLGCEVGVFEPGDVSRSCGRLVEESIDPLVSGGYAQLRTELDAAYQGSTERGAMKVQVPVQVAVDHEDFGGDDDGERDKLTPLLFEVVQLAVLQQALDQSPLPYASKWKSLFRVESLELDMLFTIKEKHFQYLYRIASCGVRVERLLVTGITITKATAPRYSFMLQQFLAANSAISPSGFASSNRIEVQHEVTRETYDAIFSALLQSSSVRGFILMETDESSRDQLLVRTPVRDRLWQWIAAAIFSPQATNPIDYVFIDSESLTMEDVMALEEALLQPQGPLSILFPGYGKKTNVACVTSSKFRLTEDEHDEDLDSVFTSDTPIECRCILDGREESEWLSVLLPGWGQAWVKRSECVIRKDSSIATREAVSIRPIKRVDIEDPMTHADGVVRGLQLIGGGIEQLKVTHTDAESSPSTSEWLTSVFEACPRLEMFDISVIPILSLEVFARCYENGICRAKRLNIHDCEITDFQANACRFFGYLADEGHAMSQYLRELVLSPRNRVDDLPGLLAPIADMLLHNRSLIQLTMSIQGPVSHHVKAVLDEISRHHGESVRSGALALTSKLAFLSVVWDCDGETSASGPLSSRSMDASVIGLVFQYAAECCKRQVSVNIQSE